MDRSPTAGARRRRARAALVRSAAALVLGLALAASGCAPRVPPPDLSLDPEALLAQVRAAQAQVRGARGEARLSVKAEGGSGVLPQLIAAERPDRVRIETLDFFGNPAAVLAASGGRFGLWDGREKVFYRGEATPENLGRLVPLPLAAEELVALLCGTAPIADGAKAVSAVAGKGYVTLVLALPGGGRQVLRVGEGGVVERSERDGPRGYRLRFEGLGTQGAVARYPSKIGLESDDPKVSLELSWREVELNAAQDAAFFRLDPPRGAKVVDLGNGPPPSPFEGWAPRP